MTRILTTVFFTFICYMTVGIPLAVLPVYVHDDLGFGTVLAGLVISAQYAATLLTRPKAGYMCDHVGPKQAVFYGLIACGGSGILMMIAALLQGQPELSYGVLLAGRLTLGFGESLVGTGAITWGIGQMGPRHTARIISWNGIATYGALAIGAPLGVKLVEYWGFAAIGASILVLALCGILLSRFKAATPIMGGEKLEFIQVFGRVFPHGMSLALGASGFGTIATFITLFYASRHWTDAAWCLTIFGASFIGARLVFAGTINRYGGHRVAIVSFTVEIAGLILLWLAATPGMAQFGAALTGLGFSLVFPALAVEAVSLVPAPNRGAALGAYSVFADLSLGATGPIAGFIIGSFGYAAIYFSAAIGVAIALGLAILLHRRNQPTGAATP
ncbi:MAG TPA: MFS transporter [Terriglobia bacterium]|nr:MFS transporter [Terriglobia bacterium]